MLGKGRKEDGNATEKNTRLSKGRNSFRFGKSKRSVGARTSKGSGKTVQVKGHSLIEELEKKQSEIFRLLDFSEDAVMKNIPAYLVGFPSMILENVIALTRELDHLIQNGNSSELSSLMSRVNQTVADHAIWIDRYYLYGDDSHNEQPITEIVFNLRQAVQNLLDFAINKEASNGNASKFLLPKSNRHNESSSSIGSQESPCSRRKYEGRNSHTHGSMPEIPGSLGQFGVCGLPMGSQSPSPSPPPKLTHSFSSDSILEKENFTSTPNSSMYARNQEGFSSCDESAPPIPPKRGNRGRGVARLSYSGCENSGLLNTSNSFNSSMSDGGGADFPESSGLEPGNRSGNYHCSLSLSSTASHDSMLRANGHGLHREVSPHSRSSVELSPRGVERPLVGFSEMDFADEERHAYFRSSSGLLDESRISGLTKTFNSHTRETRTRISSDSSSKENYKRNYSSSLTGSTRLNERNSVCSSSSRSSGSEMESNSLSVSVPPPIPKKTRPPLHGSPAEDRFASIYDNVDNSTQNANRVQLRRTRETHVVRSQNAWISHSSSTSGLGSSKSSTTSWESSVSGNNLGFCASTQRKTIDFLSPSSSFVVSNDSEKPPLPRKKKHIMEYMQIFKDHEMPESDWFVYRRSQQILPSYPDASLGSSSHYEDIRDLESNTQSLHLRSSLPNPVLIEPPALPPKTKPRHPDCSKRPPSPAAGGPPLTRGGASPSEPELCVCQRKEAPSMPPVTVAIPSSASLVNAISRNQAALSSSPDKIHRNSRASTASSRDTARDDAERLSCSDYADEETQTDPESLIDYLNVDSYVDFQEKPGDSDVKAGSADALIVYATYSKNGSYLEAFLTTYRTFTTPPELIEKLMYRYHKFKCRLDAESQKATKNAFSLLVRVVNDLVVTELNPDLLKELSEFEYNLLISGELKPALYFRKKLSEKLKMRKTHLEQLDFSNHYVSLKDPQQHSLLDFKAHEIANQMTLLDSKLFCKFGIPELLHYSRDQNEEHCPNLAAFAMQINRMSSWVKTQILKASPQDREKYYKKLIKVMKHLRKANNNFNSCIAILSGLESADVRRLDWPKSSMDMLKEYCDLFDFEGSYRAYRQALAETKPPCIPHLGIILQDLTKLHNINPNFVDGKVNFLKRWLQYNILEDMKRFIPCKYEIRKNEAILNFINDYEDCMSDADLWEMSLQIKPKPKNK